MRFKQNIALAGVALSILAAMLASISLVGSEARLVDVIALFATGFGAGASLVVALRRVPSADALRSEV